MIFAHEPCSSFSIPDGRNRVHDIPEPASDEPQQEEGYLPMKTRFALIYGAPVALLLMAGGLAMPTASASPEQNRQTSQTAYAYSHAAPAGQVHG